MSDCACAAVFCGNCRILRQLPYSAATAVFCGTCCRKMQQREELATVCLRAPGFVRYAGDSVLVCKHLLTWRMMFLNLGMNTREFAKMLHGACPPGCYSLERYGKPWRRITIEAAGTTDRPKIKPKPARASSSSSTCSPTPAVPAVPEPVAAILPVNAERMAELIAKGRATVTAEPVGLAESVPAVKPGPPDGFTSWGIERRRAWLRRNRPDLTKGEDCESKINDWLAGE